MLTNEERDIVVAAMREYPAGVSRSSWGKSLEFFDNGLAKVSGCDIELLTDAILLEGG